MTEQLASVLPIMKEVVIPYHHPNPPEQSEIEVAYLMARHFNARVEFLIPVDDYKRKTPDISISGALWEIKRPVGSSKTTISNQFKRAAKQSKYIIFDARALRMTDLHIERKVRQQFELRKSFKRVILVSKTGKIVDMKR